MLAQTAWVRIDLRGAGNPGEKTCDFDGDVAYTTFYRTGLASRTYISFAIRSYNAYGYSAWTPYACATTF